MLLFEIQHSGLYTMYMNDHEYKAAPEKMLPIEKETLVANIQYQMSTIMRLLNDTQTKIVGHRNEVLWAYIPDRKNTNDTCPEVHIQGTSLAMEYMFTAMREEIDFMVDHKEEQ